MLLWAFINPIWRAAIAVVCGLCKNMQFSINVESQMGGEGRLVRLGHIEFSASGCGTIVGESLPVGNSCAHTPWVGVCALCTLNLAWTFQNSSHKASRKAGRHAGRICRLERKVKNLLKVQKQRRLLYWSSDSQMLEIIARCASWMCHKVLKEMLAEKSQGEEG